jgi:hypothetical protein
MRQTQVHGIDIAWEKSGNQRGEMLSDGSVGVQGSRVGDWGEGQAGDFIDGICELGVCDSERSLLLIL